MKFASLGSGSEGNALLISAASSTSRTTIMIDCGFGLRETEQRLARLNMLPGDIDAIVVTHEHQDHIGGVFKFAQRHKIPVWLSFGTYEAAHKQTGNAQVNFCRDGERFEVGDLELRPYTVPHDAREPLQYVIGDGHIKLGVLTDIGQSTPHVINMLDGCNALMLECNHDTQMLAGSHYPESLKRRIGGAYGHLSNQASAEILSAIDQSHLGRVIAAHLSRKNNTEELAFKALSGALKTSRTEIAIACQDAGFDWINLKGD